MNMIVKNREITKKNSDAVRHLCLRNNLPVPADLRSFRALTALRSSTLMLENDRLVICDWPHFVLSADKPMLCLGGDTGSITSGTFLTCVLLAPSKLCAISPRDN